MGRPMMPRPMKAMFCLADMWLVPSWGGLVRGARRGRRRSAPGCLRCACAAGSAAEPAEALRGGHGRLVLQADEPVVAAGLGGLEQVGQRKVAGARLTAPGGVGDLDVAELGGVVADDRGDVVAVHREVEEV